MNLEKEFKLAVEKHKYQIVVSSLMVFEEDGIYENPLLAKYKDFEGDSETKAFAIANDLEDKANKGDVSMYDAIYEMCWDKMKHVICDTKTYGLPEGERDKPLKKLK